MEKSKKPKKPKVPKSSKSLLEALAGAHEEIKTIRDKTPIKPTRLH
jgi:ribosomal protein S11